MDRPEDLHAVNVISFGMLQRRQQDQRMPGSQRPLQELKHQVGQPAPAELKEAVQVLSEATLPVLCTWPSAWQTLLSMDTKLLVPKSVSDTSDS